MKLSNGLFSRFEAVILTPEPDVDSVRVRQYVKLHLLPVSHRTFRLKGYFRSETVLLLSKSSLRSGIWVPKKKC